MVSIPNLSSHPLGPASRAGWKCGTVAGLSSSGARSCRRPGAAAGPAPRALLFGWVRADGPAFLKSARAGTRTWHGGSSHPTLVRRPTDDSPHPVVTQISRSTISVGSVANVIGHQHHCATSKSRAARLIPTACRHELFDARRLHVGHGKPAAKGLSSRRKLS
jgi:hypothetical protein